MPAKRRREAAPVADDRAAIAERMGGAGTGGGPSARGFLASPPGSVDRRQEGPATVADAREVDAGSEAGGVVRPGRQARSRAQGTRACGEPAYERQSTCQWRDSQKSPAPAGIRRLRGEGRAAWVG